MPSTRKLAWRGLASQGLGAIFTFLCNEKIYNQRTATERINAQAKELGIERPRLRNGQAIVNQNTLIYVLINLRALRRVRRKKADRQSK